MIGGSRPRPQSVARIALIFSLLAGCGSDGGGSDSANVASAKRGYVVSSFSYVFPEHDGDPCPGGFTRGPAEIRRDEGINLPNSCPDPESFSDPGFKTLDGPGRLPGIDLDGVTSTLGQGGTCAHADFSGPSGEPGIDYGFWRAVGCVRGFQKDEISHIVIEEAVINGSMTILIDVDGVDDETNDRAVTAQIFGSTDVPPVGADGELLSFATLTIHEDQTYHGALGEGEIVDGVLLVGPMDINLRLNIQIVDGNQSLRNGYLRLEFQEDGSVSGQIFGYQPIAEAYDIFGIQAGRAGAEALSYTCTGLWSALKSEADGDPDPETGECSTISVAYRFEAVPAFVEKQGLDE